MFCHIYVVSIDQSGSSHQAGSDTLSLSHSALLQGGGHQPHPQHERVSMRQQRTLILWAPCSQVQYEPDALVMQDPFYGNIA